MQCRWGRSYPNSGSGRMPSGGEQPAQTQRPQRRQWCFLFIQPNAIRHSWQLGASASSVQLGSLVRAESGLICLDGGGGGVTGRNSVGSSGDGTPATTACKRRLYKSAAGVWYRDSSGNANHTLFETLLDGSSKKRLKRSLPPQSNTCNSVSFSVSSLSDLTNEMCTPNER